MAKVSHSFADAKQKITNLLASRHLHKIDAGPTISHRFFWVFAVLALQDRSKSLKDLCKACQPLEMKLRREAEASAPEVKVGKAQLEQVEEEEEARKGTTGL